MITRAQILVEARTWRGVPWLHQGRSRAGVDCAGLVICVAQALGLAVPAAVDYPRMPDGALPALCETYLQRIAQRDMAPADIVLMHWERLPESHLAFIADYPHGGLALLHALNRTREGAASRVIEHRMDSIWRSRIVAAYALPGVA